MFQKNKKTFLLVLLVLLLLISASAICVGRANITFKELLTAILGRLGVGLKNVSAADNVIFGMRLPRIVLAAGVGLALSVAGSVYQGIFRNPLVDPFILGVSSGAAFGAAIAMILPGFLLSIQFSSFIFAAIGVSAAYLISRVRGETPLVTLLLAGIIINSFFSALVSIIQFFSTSSELREIVFWLLGGFYYSVWSDTLKIFPLIVAGSLAIWGFGWKLNVLSMGDDEAKSMGMSVEKTKIILMTLATLITAFSVSTVGIIAWIGLLTPHAARLMIGPDHRYLIPASGLMGAILLVICDTLARSATHSEIPIGVVTSIAGAPFLILLMRSKRRLFFG